MRFTLFLCGVVVMGGCATKVSNEPPPPPPDFCTQGLVDADGQAVKTGDTGLDACIELAVAYSQTALHLEDACRDIADALKIELGAAPCGSLSSTLEATFGSPLPVECTSYGTCDGLVLQCSSENEAGDELVAALQNQGASLCAIFQCGEDLAAEFAAAQQCSTALYMAGDEGALPRAACVGLVASMLADASVAVSDAVAAASQLPICSGKL